MQEQSAGIIVTGNKEHVIGADLRAFVALKKMGGKTLQMDVMALSEAKQGMNVLCNQVSKFIEVLV